MGQTHCALFNLSFIPLLFIYSLQLPPIIHAMLRAGPWEHNDELNTPPSKSLPSPEGKALSNPNPVAGSVTEEIPRVQWELAVRDVGQPGKSRYSGQTGQGICSVECGGDTVRGDPVPWPDLKELKVT